MMWVVIMMFIPVQWLKWTGFKMQQSVLKFIIPMLHGCLIAEEETLSLQDKELELIKKSLERHNGKRKLAAQELGISERTLYRNLVSYNLTRVGKST